jgi:hypothetical protein
MKLLRLGTALSAAVLSFVPSFQASANLQVPDYLCFMTTQSGEVVNLSESLCKSNKSASEDSANSDQAFIEDYKSNLMNYPDVRDNLLASAEQSPDLTISQAKNVCNDLQSGLSLEEIQQMQADEIVERAGMVSSAIVNSLAPKYYCPEWNN